MSLQETYEKTRSHVKETGDMQPPAKECPRHQAGRGGHGICPPASEGAGPRDTFLGLLPSRTARDSVPPFQAPQTEALCSGSPGTRRRGRALGLSALRKLPHIPVKGGAQRVSGCLILCLSYPLPMFPRSHLLSKKGEEEIHFKSSKYTLV